MTGHVHAWLVKEKVIVRPTRRGQSFSPVIVITYTCVVCGQEKVERV